MLRESSGTIWTPGLTNDDTREGGGGGRREGGKWERGEEGDREGRCIGVRVGGKEVSAIESVEREGEVRRKCGKHFKRA